MLDYRYHFHPGGQSLAKRQPSLNLLIHASDNCSGYSWTTNPESLQPLGKGEGRNHSAIANLNSQELSRKVATPCDCRPKHFSIQLSIIEDALEASGKLPHCNAPVACLAGNSKIFIDLQGL